MRKAVTSRRHIDVYKRQAIIGGGYIGLEFSSMFARYGTQVTVFEYGDRLVKREDEDIALHIQQILERQGVQFEFKSNVLSVENVNDSDVIVTYKNKDGNIQQLTVNAVSYTHLDVYKRQA